jgi:hypothetical protein
MLHQSLLDPGPNATTFDVLEPPGVAHIAVGYFDIRAGPKLLDITSDILPPHVLTDYLFPSSWEDSSVFAFEVGGIYGLATGAVTHREITDRGKLQVTVVILSRSPTVDVKDWEFLSEARRLIGEVTELTFPPFVELAERCSLFDESHQMLDQPLYPFFSGGLVSKVFLRDPLAFMGMWRARVMGLSIAIWHPKKLSEITAVCAFVGAMGRPICDFRECVFHIDLPQLDKYRNQMWKVCCVTHPMLQTNDIAAVTLKAEGLSVVRSLTWVNDGHGTVVDRLIGIARTNQDRQLLDEFVELNKQILRLAASGRELSKEDVSAIGLDTRNAKFLGQFFQSRGSRTSVERLYSLC